MCTVSRRISALVLDHFAAKSKWPWLHKMSPVALTEHITQPMFDGTRHILYIDDYLLRKKLSRTVLRRLDMHALIDYAPTLQEAREIIYDAGAQLKPADFAVAKLLLRMKFQSGSWQPTKKDYRKHDAEWAFFCAMNDIAMNCKPWTALSSDVHKLYFAFVLYRPVLIERYVLPEHWLMCMEYVARKNRRRINEFIKYACVREGTRPGTYDKFAAYTVITFARFCSPGEICALYNAQKNKMMPRAAITWLCIRDDHFTVVRELLAVEIVSWRDLIDPLCALGNVMMLAVGYSLGEITDNQLPVDILPHVQKCALCLQA